MTPGFPARLCAYMPVGGTFALRAYNKFLSKIRPRRRVNTYFGAMMDCDARDVIQARIAHFGVWEPDISTVFEEMIRPGDTVVDIGANVGYYSLLASHLVGPSGGVVAVEASPIIAEILQKHILLNACSNVRVVNVAASDAPGELTLYHGPISNIGTTTTVGGRVSSDVVSKVRALPLDMILTAEETSRVSLIKIDIEGAELPVLKGILNTLDRYPLRINIVVEANPDNNNGDWQYIFDALLATGFSARAVRNEYGVGSYLRWANGRPRELLTKLPEAQTDILFTR